MAVVVSCPVCGLPLERQPGVWRCPEGHSFDVARQGYVNLLTITQKHSKNPGDTRQMAAARRDFLRTGAYAPIAGQIARLAQEFCPDAGRILDVGCGEGYYLSGLGQVFPDAKRFGLDISRESVRLAAGAYKDCVWICGTAAALPFPKASFNLLLSMFSLTAAEEFARVLEPGGIFLQVLAGQDHLLALRQIIYPQILHREKNLHPALPGFSCLHQETLEFSFQAEGTQVQNLLAMTPHFWRISQAGAQRLAAQNTLSDRAQVILNVYRRT